jgi:uncharacterized BrkB/YihY/UPF0761 family membrane protein
MKGAVQDFGRDDVMTKAAALAFYSALGLAPTVLLVLTVTAWLRPGAEEAVVNQVESMVGSQAAKVVTEVVKSTKEEQQRQASGSLSVRHFDSTSLGRFDWPRNVAVPRRPVGDETAVAHGPATIGV